jgi:hypothetical protein
MSLSKLPKSISGIRPRWNPPGVRPCCPAKRCAPVESSGVTFYATRSAARHDRRQRGTGPILEEPGTARCATTNTQAAHHSRASGGPLNLLPLTRRTRMLLSKNDSSLWIDRIRSGLSPVACCGSIRLLVSSGLLVSFDSTDLCVNYTRMQTEFLFFLFKKQFSIG